MLLAVLVAAPLARAAAMDAKAARRAHAEYRRLIKANRSQDKLQAVEALRGVDNKRAAKSLMRLIKSANCHAVARRAMEVLGGYASDEVADAVAKAARRPPGKDERKLLLLEALSRIRNPRVEPALLRLLRSKDRRYRILAMEGLANLRRPAASLVEALTPFATQDRDFGLRISAVTALAQIPHPAAVSVLLEAAKVPGRIKETALRGLMLLTGQTLGSDPETWEKWWQAHRQGYKVDVKRVQEKGLAAAPLVVPIDDYSFYGIRIVAKRVLFIIDKSGSMGQGRYPRRIDGVKTELLRLLEQLDEQVRFNIVFFNHQIFFWRGMTLHPATAKNKAKAKAYVQGIKPGGATFTDEVMAKSFRFVVAKQGVETICLLTDGAPYRRGFLDMDKVAADIQAANRFLKARINTIGCFTEATEQQAAMAGEPPRAELVGFLKRIAQENWGVFKEIQGMAHPRR